MKNVRVIAEESCSWIIQRVSWNRLNCDELTAYKLDFRDVFIVYLRGKLLEYFCQLSPQTAWEEYVAGKFPPISILIDLNANFPNHNSLLKSLRIFCGINYISIHLSRIIHRILLPKGNFHFSQEKKYSDHDLLRHSFRISFRLYFLILRRKTLRKKNPCWVFAYNYIQKCNQLTINAESVSSSTQNDFIYRKNIHERPRRVAQKIVIELRAFNFRWRSNLAEACQTMNERK